MHRIRDAHHVPTIDEGRFYSRQAPFMLVLGVVSRATPLLSAAAAPSLRSVRVAVVIDAQEAAIRFAERRHTRELC